MRKINHKPLLFGILATASTLTGVQAAPKAKPKPKTPAKPAAKPQPKPSGVLGMVPMSGVDGKMGQTYTLGTDSPLNFTLNSAEYTLERVNVGEESFAPNKDEKLLVLRYTIHNPNKFERNYSWAALHFTAVDAKNQNREYMERVGATETGEPLNMDLKPAQKVEGYTFIKVPATGVVPKLIVKPENGGVIRYDLRTGVKPLTAPFSDNGTNVVEEIPAQNDTYYPLQMFDVKLVGTAYVDTLVDVEREEDQRFFVATISLRNTTKSDKDYSWSTFVPQLIDTDGEEVRWPQTLLKATRDEGANGTLKPGQEYKARFYFPLPKNIQAKTLKLREDESHTYVFDVSNTN